MVEDQKNSCTNQFAAEVLMVLTSSVITILVLVTCANAIFSAVRHRRSTSGEGTSLFLSTAYNLFLPLMSYLFSQAKLYNPEGKAQVILIWMVLIEIIRIRSDPIFMWQLQKSAEQLIRLIWVGYLVYSYTPLPGIMASLFFLCAYFAIFEVLKGSMFKISEDSYLIGKNPKVIHNYMKRVLHEEKYKTTPMSSCDYIVIGEENHKITVCDDGYLLGDQQSTNHHNNQQPTNLQNTFELLSNIKLCSDGISVIRRFFQLERNNNYLNSEEKLTIGRVFQLTSPEDAFAKNPEWRDTCLTLALAKMLRRRFVNLPLDEANNSKALDFVKEGLIDYYIGTNQDIPTDQNNSGERKPKAIERVFTIIQKELKLVSEFLCVEVPIYHYYAWYILFDIIGSSILLYCGVYLIIVIFRNSSAWLSLVADKAYDHCFFNKFRSGSQVVKIFSGLDLAITAFLLCACIYMQSTGSITVLVSDLWSNLRSVEGYIKSPVKSNIARRAQVLLCPLKLAFSIFQYVSKLLLKSEEDQFKKATYQCSVLDARAETVLWCIKCKLSIFTRFPKLIRRNIHRDIPTVYPSTDAKEAILNSLKNSDGQVTNGEASLSKHGKRHLAWACQPSGSNTEAILTWHIATTLFDHLESLREQNGIVPIPQQDFLKERKVALELSSYCYYLVAYQPKLLPDEAEWTENQYDSVIKEILALDQSINQKPTKGNRCELIVNKWINPPIRNPQDKILAGNSVLGKGIKLAKDLGDCPDQARAPVWAMLAEFWAEMMLFIAPSDNLKAHEEMLERGEFITQVWALLTHAGILSRPKITLIHAVTGDRYHWNTDTKVMQYERSTDAPVTRPSPWVELNHSVTDKLYFWNPVTKVLQYERPPPDAPAPALSGELPV